MQIYLLQIWLHPRSFLSVTQPHTFQFTLFQVDLMRIVSSEIDSLNISCSFTAFLHMLTAHTELIKSMCNAYTCWSLLLSYHFLSVGCLPLQRLAGLIGAGDRWSRSAAISHVRGGAVAHIRWSSLFLHHEHWKEGLNFWHTHMWGPFFHPARLQLLCLTHLSH